MLAASDRFQREFVAHQPGVVRRVLVTDASGGYADLVFFRDEHAIAEVMAAEQTNDVCAAFFALWEGGEPTMYRTLRVHER